MNFKLRAILFSFLLLLGLSCKDELNFPIEPFIELRSQKYVLGSGTMPDSLHLDIYFRDGDFDLGLDYGDLAPPYNEFNYLLKSGETISYFDLNKLSDYINYAYKRTLVVDTFPDFTPPFDCTNWVVLRNQSNQAFDTVYRVLNKNFFNLIIDPFIVLNDGTVEPFRNNNSVYPNCDVYGLNSRFPKPFGAAPPSIFLSPISKKEGILISKKAGILKYRIS